MPKYCTVVPTLQLGRSLCGRTTVLRVLHVIVQSLNNKLAVVDGAPSLGL